MLLRNRTTTDSSATEILRIMRFLIKTQATIECMTRNVKKLSIDKHRSLAAGCEASNAEVEVKVG